MFNLLRRLFKKNINSVDNSLPEHPFSSETRQVSKSTLEYLNNKKERHVAPLPAYNKPMPLRSTTKPSDGVPRANFDSPAPPHDNTLSNLLLLNMMASATDDAPHQNTNHSDSHIDSSPSHHHDSSCHHSHSDHSSSYDYVGSSDYSSYDSGGSFDGGFSTGDGF